MEDSVFEVLSATCFFGKYSVGQSVCSLNPQGVVCMFVNEAWWSCLGEGDGFHCVVKRAYLTSEGGGRRKWVSEHCPVEHHQWWVVYLGVHNPY